MKEITYQQHIDDEHWKVQIIDTGKTLPLTEKDCPDVPTIVWDIAVLVDDHLIFNSQWFSDAMHPPTPMNVMTSLISHVVDAALVFIQNHQRTMPDVSDNVKVIRENDTRSGPGFGGAAH